MARCCQSARDCPGRAGQLVHLNLVMAFQLGVRNRNKTFRPVSMPPFPVGGFQCIGTFRFSCTDYFSCFFGGTRIGNFVGNRGEQRSVPVRASEILPRRGEITACQQGLRAGRYITVCSRDRGLGCSLWQTSCRFDSAASARSLPGMD